MSDLTNVRELVRKASGESFRVSMLIYEKLELDLPIVRHIHRNSKIDSYLVMHGYETPRDVIQLGV
jgi:hypothetical protein